MSGPRLLPISASWRPPRVSGNNEGSRCQGVNCFGEGPEGCQDHCNDPYLCALCGSQNFSLRRWVQGLGLNLEEAA